MHIGNGIPKVSEHTPLSDALVEMTQKGLGMTGIVDSDDRALGIFTDGDLRRLFERKELDLHNTTIGDVMTRHCRTAGPEMLAAEALNMMETYKINALLIVDDEQKIVGAINMHDLLRAGVV